MYRITRQDISSRSIIEQVSEKIKIKVNKRVRPEEYKTGCIYRPGRIDVIDLKKEILVYNI